MEFLNKIELKGVVGKSTTSVYGGQYVTNFSLVTENVSRDKDGYSHVTDVTWFHCTKWGDVCEFEPKKGDKVHVVGRMRSRRYTDQNGNERTSWDVLVQKLESLPE